MQNLYVQAQNIELAVSDYVLAVDSLRAGDVPSPAGGREISHVDAPSDRRPPQQSPDFRDGPSGAMPRFETAPTDQSTSSGDTNHGSAGTGFQVHRWNLQKLYHSVPMQQASG
ncbi:hypothetical protein TNCV_4315301 [Trichonephila clavipes]|nr:hypothetical protein TNCV_4315301 [Trichonephila clavipes]